MRIRRSYNYVLVLVGGYLHKEKEQRYKKKQLYKSP